MSRCRCRRAGGAVMDELLLLGLCGGPLLLLVLLAAWCGPAKVFTAMT